MLITLIYILASVARHQVRTLKNFMLLSAAVSDMDATPSPSRFVSVFVPEKLL